MDRKPLEDALFDFLDNLTSTRTRLTHYNDVMSLVDDIEKITSHETEIDDLEDTISELEADVDNLKSTVNYMASETEDFVNAFEKKLSTESDTEELKKDLKAFGDNIHDSSWWV